MLCMGESTTAFDPLGRTRGKPSQLLLDTYKYLEYLYKYSIRFHQPSAAKLLSICDESPISIRHVPFSVGR